MSYSNNQQRRQRNNSSPVKYNGTGSSNRNRSNSNTAKKKSTLDPSLLVKEANHSAVEKVFQSERQISDLPISAKLIQALESKGYKKPTEIQDRTLETLMTGRDLLGIAQTGTGKTGPGSYYRTVASQQSESLCTCGGTHPGACASG